MYRYIAVEGNIGAGKTELAKIIAQNIQGRLILEEFASNTYLGKFYQNPERYAFPLEISFLVERFQQMNFEMKSGDDLFQSTYVSDYLFEKSLVFARKNLSHEHYLLFKRLFDIFRPQIPAPDLILYLHRPVDQALANISKRGREFEAELGADYLEEIEKNYFEYLKTVENKRIVVINLEGADFVNDLSIQKSLLWLLKQKHPRKFSIVDI